MPVEKNTTLRTSSLLIDRSVSRSVLLQHARISHIIAFLDQHIYRVTLRGTDKSNKLFIIYTYIYILYIYTMFPPKNICDIQGPSAIPSLGPPFQKIAPGMPKERDW